LTTDNSIFLLHVLAIRSSAGGSTEYHGRKYFKVNRHRHLKKGGREREGGRGGKR